MRVLWLVWSAWTMTDCALDEASPEATGSSADVCSATGPVCVCRSDGQVTIGNDPSKIERVLPCRQIMPQASTPDQCERMVSGAQRRFAREVARAFYEADHPGPGALPYDRLPRSDGEDDTIAPTTRLGYEGAADITLDLACRSWSCSIEDPGTPL